ncbi:MAG: UDP-N-acetylglucosamine 1-carboxyvinyltransferase [Proteobacteria bacterium]|uniref:UDP-N-acetylglucosamine 1-carboxyvinyltransferase n=1 Tax=Candidatus Avisuccinivibrio stercorigallinarum TaxID=2840704 RepID=A0A9D9GSY1_9GAMM|nr:UDP-N-acetylglucosamine 1-carboxyvinyltransferase [Candidatus Avisuccinivibrio stercorigallinarum]
MDKFQIIGGRTLQGELNISGAKNAALPIILCTMLTSDTVVLKNVPDLRDVKTCFKLLQILGKDFTKTGENEYTITGSIKHKTAPYDLVKTMRASIMALGPLTAYLGEAEVSLPGGCAIGARPVDLHVKGLIELGAEISLDEGYIRAKAPGGRLHGGTIVMDKISVTGTENLMMAAALAEGTTVIENAALEPEVVDLACCLRMMGADITGDGTATITIKGCPKLHGGEHTIVSDRIETGTYLIAAMATHGQIVCHRALPSSLEAVLSKLRQAGAQIEVNGTDIFLDMQGRDILPVDITTAPHPGFPTDMQAQFTVLNALAKGSSFVKETIFENRFMHIPELIRMGAHLKIEGNTVFCQGVDHLTGAQVMATDLRASASLVIAGLVAQGTTIVDRIYHMDRGYEHIENKVRALGGTIERIS